MQREERIITSHCVNIIVPFAMLGLFANFIPWLLILVPLEEQDVCWFYFLTRSPYQLDYIEPWIYTTANVIRFTIWVVELGFLIYFVYQISVKNMKMNQINIKTESILITCEWLVLTVIFMSIKIFQKMESNKPGNKDSYYENQKTWQVVSFGILITRNLLAISIAYVCSILLVNHDFKNKAPNDQWDTQ